MTYYIGLQLSATPALKLLSLQARWALDYHAAPYDWSVYMPMHSELMLRWKLWQWTGRVSVPVLLTAEGTPEAAATLLLGSKVTAVVSFSTLGLQLLSPAGNLTESLDIAKWAEAHSTKPESEKLFPEQLLESITRSAEALPAHA